MITKFEELLIEADVKFEGKAHCCEAVRRNSEFTGIEEGADGGGCLELCPLKNIIGDTDENLFRRYEYNCHEVREFVFYLMNHGYSLRAIQAALWARLVELGSDRMWADEDYRAEVHREIMEVLKC